MEVVFSSPYYLWALLIVPIMILVHFISLKYSKKRALKFANFIALARVSEKVGISSNYVVLFLRIFVFIVIILAIAGTSIWYEGSRMEADYVIAVDASASMLTEDLEPTRLDVAKETAIDFIDNLNPLYSSAAIISFSGVPFVHQTLTKDKRVLKDVISEINIRKIGGTDIGNTIISATNILLASDKPKVIILITDGRDNIGVSYMEAINYANENNVMVFTVGIGLTVESDSLTGSLGIDEEQLQNIAELTGGKYYQITSRAEFENFYDSILIEGERKVSLDLTFPLLLAVLFLLVLEWVLINTRFRIIP